MELVTGTDSEIRIYQSDKSTKPVSFGIYAWWCLFVTRGVFRGKMNAYENKETRIILPNCTIYRGKLL